MKEWVSVLQDALNGLNQRSLYEAVFSRVRIHEPGNQGIDL